MAVFVGAVRAEWNSPYAKWPIFPSKAVFWAFEAQIMNFASGPHCKDFATAYIFA